MTSVQANKDVIKKKNFKSQHQLKKSLEDLINKAPLKLTQANIFKEKSKTLNIKGPSKKVNVKNKKGNEQRSLLLPLNVEYYPDKVKRQGPVKKAVLHPKHDYKVVATLNKRKRRIPHKGCQPAKMSSQPDLMTSVDLDMDDEDLMEILTCPSPVWWEDPTEEMYIQVYEDEEGEALKFTNKHKRKNIEEKLTQNDPKSNIIRTNRSNVDRSKGALKCDINFFKKFVEKRSKLENVLGNIKKISCEVKDNDGKHEISVNTNEIKKDLNEINKNDFSKNEGKKQRKDSSSGCSDISINEEELVNTLENIEIPVQKTHPGLEKETVNDIKLSVNNDDTLKRRSGRLRKPKRNFYDLTESKKIDKIRLEIPNDLPPLTKKPFRNVQFKPICSSPKSIDSETQIVEFDSISDTNVKFLDEYDEKVDCDKNEITVTKEKNGNDLVTIYRILSQKIESDDIEDQIQANLVNKIPHKTNNEIVLKFDTSPKGNTEKKVKKANKNNKKDFKQESVNVNNRSLLVANKCVNYCHSCSSVFDTETCQYCKKKA